MSIVENRLAWLAVAGVVAVVSYTGRQCAVPAAEPSTATAPAARQRPTATPGLSEAAKAEAVELLGAAVSERQQGNLGIALELARQAQGKWPDYADAKRFVAEVGPEATRTARSNEATATAAARTANATATAQANARALGLSLGDFRYLKDEQTFVITNISGGPINLGEWVNITGMVPWQFPSVILQSGQQITVHTKPGRDTPTDIYMNIGTTAAPNLYISGNFITISRIENQRDYAKQVRLWLPIGG